MTVLCVNSAVTYADITAADAAEGGTDYGVPTRFEQSGTSISAVTFIDSDYPSSFIYTATSGEEATGDISVGAGTTAPITSTVTDCQILDLRTAAITLTSSTNPFIRRLVVDSGGADGVVFPNTIDAEDILIHNCDDGFLSSVVRTANTINKCTVVGAGRFGFAQGVFTNCVDVNSANQGYFNEQAGSSALWEHDGTGTNTITESPATDIFEDYAGGDYRIKASSSPGLAGAGAFINSAPPATGVTGDIDFTIGAPSFSATGSSTLPQPSGSIAFNIDAPVFSASGSATLPNPSGTIDFAIAPPSFSSSGSATLPQPSGDVSFTVSAPIFSGTGSASFPYPQGVIAFDINSPTFSGTGTATQPNPTGNASFTIDSPVFTSTGSATLPNPSGSINFTINGPTFSATGAPSLPYPVGNVSFDIDAPSFSGTGSVTLPNPSGDIAYTISAPQFSATGSVSGLVIPFGDVLTLTSASNVITLPYTSNTIKL